MFEKYKNIPSDKNNVETDEGEIIVDPELMQEEKDEEIDTEKIDIPKSNKDKLSTEGASVSLKDRLDSIEKISEQISHQSQLQGAREQINIPNSPFRRRYKNPEEMLANMETKQETLKGLASEALKTLSASDKLIEAGFDAEDVANNKSQNDKEVVFGLRSKSAEDRRKLIKKIKKVTPK